MQLIETHVDDANGTTTVVFAGEGNEEVSVRMSVAGLDRTTAIMRAKGMLVQLTVFEEHGAGSPQAVVSET